MPIVKSYVVGVIELDASVSLPFKQLSSNRRDAQFPTDRFARSREARSIVRSRPRARIESTPLMPADLQRLRQDLRAETDRVLAMI